MSADELQAALQRVSDAVTAKLAAMSTQLATDDLLLVDESAADSLWLAMKELTAVKSDPANRVDHALRAFELFAAAGSSP